MIGLGDLFKRIRNVHSREVLIRTVIQEAVRKNAGIDIKLEDISFGSESARISNISQAARSAIFIKKQSILKEIGENQQIRKITDIK